jgi:threonine dehydratase
MRVRRLVGSVHLVAEDGIARAMSDLFRHDGVVAEGAGAVGVALVSSIGVRLEGPIVVVISGRNLDAGTLTRVLEST